MTEHEERLTPAEALAEGYHVTGEPPTLDAARPTKDGTKGPKMSKLSIAALAMAMGLGIQQVPALRDLRLTDDVEVTPIPEEIRKRVSEEAIAAAEAKRKRKLDKRKKAS